MVLPQRRAPRVHDYVCWLAGAQLGLPNARSVQTVQNAQSIPGCFAANQKLYFNTGGDATLNEPSLKAICVNMAKFEKEYSTSQGQQAVEET